MPSSNFFNIVRSKLYFGTMQQLHVDGFNWLLIALGNNLVVDRRFEAYILATTYHETAFTMQPIEEYGRGLGKPYGPDWYGRGYVQLTWEYNYVRMSPFCGADLHSNPALALQPAIAANVLISGMLRGLFTGRKLGDYFNAQADPINARRIINGTDKATLIAQYYSVFMEALA